MPIDNESGKVVYKETINASGSRDELFKKAMDWLHNYTECRSAVYTTYFDKTEGIIEGKINLMATYSFKSNLWFINASYTIELKENECSITINNFYSYSTTLATMYAFKTEDTPLEKNENFDIKDFSKKNDYAKNIDANIKAMIEALKKAL
jgi:hypothetical protein